MSEQVAGRELDARIAVEVMGWVRQGESWYDEEGVEGTRFISGYGELEIRSEGPLDDGMWTVLFGVEAKGTAPKLPLAICIAALQAMTNSP